MKTDFFAFTNIKLKGGEQLDKLLLGKGFLGHWLAAGRSGSITAVDYPQDND